MSTVYVFGLVDAKAGGFTEAGHRIEFVPAGAVYAAVERLGERPAVSEETLRAQHRIVERIAAKVDAVLPARFGSLVDLGELDRVVALRRGGIRDALELVRGRTQMTVRLLDAVVRAPVAPPPHRGAVTESGTAYLQARRQAGVRVLSPAVAAVTGAVRDIVAAERAEAGEGRVAATLYHLVGHAGVEKYRKRLAALQAGLDQQTLSISGPWPPFAFVPELWP
jgi:hypothetical protein